jgi:hypothetical protein
MHNILMRAHACRIAHQSALLNYAVRMGYCQPRYGIGNAPAYAHAVMLLSRVRALRGWFMRYRLRCRTYMQPPDTYGDCMRLPNASGTRLRVQAVRTLCVDTCSKTTVVRNYVRYWVRHLEQYWASATLRATYVSKEPMKWTHGLARCNACMRLPECNTHSQCLR